MTGKVIKLFTTFDDENKTRVSPEFITVDNNGVYEDKFYAKDLLRSVLITSLESYEIAKKEGVEIEYGSLGENILIDINPYNLIPGETLQIGETTFEITQNCTLCKGLSSVNSKLPKVLKNDRGIFAKVISGKSVIKIGNVIKI